MPKIHTLDFPKDEKTADDFVQLAPASVRQCYGRFWVLRVGTGEGGGSVALGFHCRQSRSRELLCLEVRFGTHNGGLSSVEIRRRRVRGACSLGGGDGLPGVAQFLYGGASASDQAGNSEKYSKEAQHRVTGH